jgi:hypothetical protein
MFIWQPGKRVTFGFLMQNCGEHVVDCVDVRTRAHLKYLYIYSIYSLYLAVVLYSYSG